MPINQLKKTDPQWLSEQIALHGASNPRLIGTGYEGDILFLNVGGKEYGLRIDEINEILPTEASPGFVDIHTKPISGQKDQTIFTPVRQVDGD